MFGGLIGSIAGSTISSLANWGISSSSAKKSKREAERQRNWQQQMSDTAHQREVADLRAAGLNPILSAGGSGASTPSGAMANMNMGSPFDIRGDEAIAKTISKERNSAVENMQADTKLKKASKETQEELGKMYAAQGRQAVASAKSLEVQLPTIRKQQAFFQSPFGHTLWQMNQGVPIVNAVNGMPFGLLKKIPKPANWRQTVDRGKGVPLRIERIYD